MSEKLIPEPMQKKEKQFKIEIFSDGTTGGTLVKIDGQPISFIEYVKFSASSKKDLVDFAIKKMITPYGLPAKIMRDGVLVDPSPKTKRNKK